MLKDGSLTGSTLDNRYRVGEQIGEGGFGSVYVATHVHLGARVAIKVPSVARLATPEAISDAVGRFMTEGRTLARLRHPNIGAALDVALLPADQDGTTLPYLVLEWCGGLSLKAWRASRQGLISPREVWTLLRPAFDAIAYAHREGVAHRDLKPANVLLEETEAGALVPRVIDFGIAKLLGGEQEGSGATETLSTSRAFTPTYAAPEQLMGLKSGPRSDVYSLSIILLEMVSGERVFNGADEAMAALLDADLPTPKKLGLELGRWDAVLTRALSAKPQDRYPDAGALMEALEPAPESVSRRQAETVATRPRAEPAPTAPTAVQPAPKRPRRWAAAAIGAAATGAVIAGALSLRSAPAAAPTLATTSNEAATASAASARPSVASTPPNAPSSLSPRPLSALRGSEAVRKLASAGLDLCQVDTDNDTFVLVSCGRAQLHVGRYLGLTDAQIRGRLRELARRRVVGGLAGRITTDGEWGALLLAPRGDVQGVLAALCSGVRCGEADVVNDAVMVDIPARLADWRPETLASAAMRAGGTVTSDITVRGLTSVGFSVEGGLVTLELHQGESARHLIARVVEKQTADVGDQFTFAYDGDTLLKCRSTRPLDDESMLTRVLGATSFAARGARKGP